MKRLINKRKFKKVCTFIVEGETEKWYINQLKIEENISHIKISPEIIRKSSLKYQYHMIEEYAEYSDIIYWIIDYDIIKYQDFQSKTNRCSEELKIYINKLNISRKLKNKIVIIINNPCLEFWFLLHFKYSSRQYQNYKELKFEFGKIEILKNYEKTHHYYKNLYSKLKPFLSIAVNNAKKLDQINNIYLDRPNSGMYKIFENFNIK